MDFEVIRMDNPLYFDRVFVFPSHEEYYKGLYEVSKLAIDFAVVLPVYGEYQSSIPHIMVRLVNYTEVVDALKMK